jgi:hypothetical protein
MTESKPIYIFFHICCINNWHSIVTKIYNEIRVSGLYDKVTGIHCGVLGRRGQINHPIFSDPKVTVLFCDNNPLAFERPTLNKLYELSLTRDFYALYIHSKGVKHNGQNPCVDDWVDYVTYFNIHKHEECISRLSEFDAVGVNLYNYEGNIHFSGNFWWSKSTYIRKLNPTIGPNYTDPEFWIATGENRALSSLFNSVSVNHYQDRFLPDQYVGKPVIYDSSRL